ncbi:unnamed protein product [Coffea canephora]|uniref:Uncharacterized protein n=1 Tax=Coffea canephora TaxID=49390 RepID=A0A068UR57_COFCA|nr:unnamed protein product [Coffea canephora]
MSFWWLVPQYILFGLADVFNQVGMQEFFYDQVPIELRSVGLSFYYGALGIGNFLSSFLVSMIDKATSLRGRESWFSDNLNHAHIDYFYWLLAGIGDVGLIIFVYLSRFYSCAVQAHVYYKGSPGGWRSASFMLAGGSLESSQFYFYKLLLAFPLVVICECNEVYGYFNSILFFVSLYLIALAQGYKPCVQAFGANQFNGKHQEKSKAKSSFFNWWLCGLCIGSIVAHLILHYIQHNISWALGFGIPCLVMILGLILFLLGHRTYFFDVKRGDEESPFGRIKWDIAKGGDALSNRAQASSSQEECQEYLRITKQIRDTKDLRGSVKLTYVHGRGRSNISTMKKKYKSRRKVDVLPGADDHSTDIMALPSKTKEQEQKNVLRLLPIRITCLTYTIASSQASTLFLKQATTLDKSIGPKLNIPSATLNTVIPLTIMFCIPIYDQIFVPIAKKITKYIPLV